MSNAELAASYKLLAKRRAAAVAIASIDTLLLSPHMQISLFNRLRKERTAIEVAMLQAEQDFCDSLQHLRHRDKIVFLFEHFDVHHRGAVGLAELRVGLGKLRKHRAVRAILPTPEKIVDTFASNRHGDLLPEEFGTFIDGLCAAAVGCSFDEIVALIVTNLAFCQDGKDFLREAVASMMDSSAGREEEEEEEEHLVMAVQEARLIILFQALAFNDTADRVDVLDVFRHLFRFTKSIGHCLKHQAAEILKEQHLRRLDYHMFSDLLHELAHSIHCFRRGTDIHEIANAMTLSLCSDSTDHLEFMQIDPTQDVNDGDKKKKKKKSKSKSSSSSSSRKATEKTTSRKELLDTDGGTVATVATIEETDEDDGREEAGMASFVTQRLGWKSPTSSPKATSERKSLKGDRKTSKRDKKAPKGEECTSPARTEEGRKRGDRRWSYLGFV